MCNDQWRDNHPTLLPNGDLASHHLWCTQWHATSCQTESPQSMGDYPNDLSHYSAWCITRATKCEASRKRPAVIYQNQCCQQKTYHQTIPKNGSNNLFVIFLRKADCTVGCVSVALGLKQESCPGPFWPQIIALKRWRSNLIYVHFPRDLSTF